MAKDLFDFEKELNMKEALYELEAISLTTTKTIIDIGEKYNVDFLDLMDIYTTVLSKSAKSTRRISEMLFNKNEDK